jgi:hypothetical protein
LERRACQDSLAINARTMETHDNRRVYSFCHPPVLLRPMGKASPKREKGF